MDDEAISAPSCAIEIDAVEAWAGTEFTLAGAVTCDPPTDLGGHTLRIENESGATVGSAVLAGFDGQSNIIQSDPLTAPLSTGRVSWRAVCPACERDGLEFPETAAAFEVTAKAHPTNIVVWDVPTTIVVGERFRIKVGAKCGIGCNLAGSVIAVYDQDGNLKAKAITGNEPWHGTEALHYAELELEAPGAEALHRWEARVDDTADSLPHDAGSSAFRVRTVGSPECVVTVEAVDHETLKGVPGAQVVMHPYRAVTDERGVAQISASKGTYTVFVSKAKYDPMSIKIDLKDDWKGRVDLVHELPEPDPSDAYA